MARLVVEANTARRDSQVEQSQQANIQAEQAQNLQQAVQVDLNTILGLQTGGKELNVLQQLNQDLAQRNESIENSVIFDPTKQLQQVQAICKFLNLSTSADPGSSTQSALLELIYEASKKKKEERFFLLPSQRVVLQNLLMREPSTEADRQLLTKLSQCVPGLSADSCAKLLSDIGKIVEGTQASVNLSDRTSDKAKEMILEQVTKVVTEAGLDLDDQEIAEAVKNLQDLLANNLSNNNTEISVQSAVENIVSRINPERGIDPNDWDQLSRHIIHSMSNDFKEHFSDRQRLADLLTDTYQSAVLDVNKTTQSFDVEKAKEALSLSLVTNTEDRDIIVNSLQAMYNAEHGIEQDLNLAILSGTTQTLKVETVEQLHDLVERTAVAQVGLEVSNDRLGVAYVNTHAGDDITYDNSELVESQQLVVHEMVLEQVNDVKSIEVENIISELEVKQRQDYLESVRRLAENLALQEYLENNKREDKQKIVVEFAQEYLQKHSSMDVLTRAERESFFAETLAEFDRRYAGSVAIVFEDLRKQIAEQVQKDLDSTAGSIKLEQVQDSVSKIAREIGNESQDARNLITQTYQLELERAQERKELPNFELAQKVIEQIVLEKVQTSTLLPETQSEISQAFQALVNEQDLQVLSERLREYANAKINEQLATNQVTAELLAISKQANKESGQAVIDMIARLNEAQVQQLQRNLEVQSKTSALELLKTSVNAERLPVLTALLEVDRKKSEAQLLILALEGDKSNSEQAKQALAYRTGIDNIETWLETQHGSDLDRLVAELDTEVSADKDGNISKFLESAVEKKIISEATLMRLDLVANKEQIVEQIVKNQSEVNKQLLLEVAQGKYGDFATISEEVKRQTGSDLSEIARQMAERQQLTASEYAMIKAEMESDYEKVIALKLEQNSTSKNEYTDLVVLLAKSKDAERARVLNELSVITDKEQTYEMVLEKASAEGRIDPIVVDYAIGIKNKDANYINAVALYELTNKPDVSYDSLRTSLELIKNQAGVNIDQVVNNFETVAKERTFVMVLDKLAEEKKISALEAQALKETASSQESQNLRFIEAQLQIERIQQQVRDGVDTRASTANLLEYIENLSDDERKSLLGYVNGLNLRTDSADNEIIIKVLSANTSFDRTVLRSLHCLGLYDREQKGSFNILEFNKIVGQLEPEKYEGSLRDLIERIQRHVKEQNLELARSNKHNAELQLSIVREQELLNNLAHSDHPELYITGLIYDRHVAENPTLELKLDVLREQLKGQVLTDQQLVNFILQDIGRATEHAGLYKGLVLAQGESSFSNLTHEQNIKQEALANEELQYTLASYENITRSYSQVKESQTTLYSQSIVRGIESGLQLRTRDLATEHALLGENAGQEEYDRATSLYNREVNGILSYSKQELSSELASQVQAKVDQLNYQIRVKGGAYAEGLIRYENASQHAKTLFSNFGDREASIDFMKSHAQDAQLISTVYGKLIESNILNPSWDDYRKSTAHEAFLEAHYDGNESQASLHFRRWSSTLGERKENKFFEEASQIHLGVCNGNIEQVVSVLSKQDNESEEAWRYRINSITTTFEQEFASQEYICNNYYGGRSTLNDIIHYKFSDNNEQRAFSLFIANQSANSVAVESRRLALSLETLSPTALKASELYLNLSPEAKTHFDAVTGGFEKALERTDISVYKRDEKLIEAVTNNNQLDIAVESLRLAIDNFDEKVQTAGIRQIFEGRQTLSKKTFELLVNSLDASDGQKELVQKTLNMIPGDNLTADQVRVLTKELDPDNWVNSLKKLGITPVSGQDVVQRFQEVYKTDLLSYYDQRHTHKSNGNHVSGVISKGSDQFGYKMLGELIETGSLSDATRFKYYIVQEDKYSAESFAYKLASNSAAIEEFAKSFKEKFRTEYKTAISSGFSNDQTSDILAAFEGLPDTPEKKFERFDNLFKSEESYHLFNGGLDVFLSSDEVMEKLHVKAKALSEELEKAKANNASNVDQLRNELNLVCEQGLNSIETYRMARNCATDVACQVTTTVAVIGTSIVITVASGGTGAPLAVIIIASAGASLGAEVGTRVLLAGEITEEQLQRAFITAGVDGLTAGTTGIMFKGAKFTIGKLGGDMGQELLEAAGKKGFTGIAARTAAGSLEGGLQGAQAGFIVDYYYNRDLNSALTSGAYEGTLGAIIGGIISDPSHRLANRFKGKGGAGEGGAEYIADPKTPSSGGEGLPVNPENIDPDIIKFPAREGVSPVADAPSIAAKENGVIGGKADLGEAIEVKPESDLITTSVSRNSADGTANTRQVATEVLYADSNSSVDSRLLDRVDGAPSEASRLVEEAFAREAFYDELIRNSNSLDTVNTRNVRGAEVEDVLQYEVDRQALHDYIPEKTRLNTNSKGDYVAQPGVDGADAIPNRPGLYEQLQVDVNEGVPSQSFLDELGLTATNRNSVEMNRLQEQLTTVKNRLEQVRTNGQAEQVEFFSERVAEISEQIQDLRLRSTRTNRVDTKINENISDSGSNSADDLVPESQSKKTADANEPNIDDSSSGESSDKDPNDSWKNGEAHEWTPDSDVPDADRYTDDGEGGTALKTQQKTVEKVDADTGSDLPDAPTQEELDDLCDRLFNAPEPAKTNQPEVDSPQTTKPTKTPANPEPATNAPVAEPARKLQPETAQTASPSRQARVVTEDPRTEFGLKTTPTNELDLGLDTKLGHSLDKELGLHPTLRPHPHLQPQPEPVKSANAKKTQTGDEPNLRRRPEFGSGAGSAPEHEMKKRLEEERLVDLVEVEGDEPGYRRRIRARRHKVITHTDKIVSESEARFSGLELDQEFEVEKGN